MRRKSPQGEWITKCEIISLVRGYESARAGNYIGSAIFTDLEPGVTYEARYRDTNLSECHENPPAPEPWSAITEGMTHLVPPPRVEFVDATLARAVRKALGLDTQGEHIELLQIPEAELPKLTALEYSSDDELNPPNFRSEIVNLTGLEHATQLATLSLQDNNISDLTPLAQLTQLTELDLGGFDGNNISDLKPLTQLTLLRELDLSDNNISDLTPLAQLTQLTTLHLPENSISDLTPLAQLTQLTELDLGGFDGNNISDLKPLTQLTQLRELDLSNNNISDVTPLAQLTQLKWLYLWFNNISDITPLSQLINLEFLYLSYNNISDFTPLAQLSQRTRIYAVPFEGAIRPSDIELMTVSTPQPLTEATLNGSSVTLTLLPSGAAYDTSIDNIRNALIVSGIDGVTVSDVTRVSDTNLEVVLEFTGSLENTTALTFTVGAEGVSNYEGRAFTGEIPVSATTTPELPTTDALISISPASVPSPNVGEQLEFMLNITGAEAVAGYQATVQFDTTALRYVSSANGDYLPAGAFFVQPVVEGNLVNLNAASLAGESSGDGTLAMLTFEVIAVKASTLTLSDVLLSNSAGESAVPQVENAQITEPTGLKGDVNGDGVVNIQDLVLVAGRFGQSGKDKADVNKDGIVNIQDLVLVAGAFGNTAAAPALRSQALAMLNAADVQGWLTQAHGLNLTDAASQRGIIFLEQLLSVLIPKETALLHNYPNPFNPETWIPYDLAKDAEVTLHIYAVNGTLVRTLALGHQAAGIYQNRSRAAYWDGRNAFGEKVASGLYFYTLTAGDFSATRKMLIRK